MNPERRRAILLAAALFGVVFLAGLAAGYVYSHEPARDTLLLRVEAPEGAADAPRYRAGVAIDALTVEVEAAPVTLPAGLPLEDLERVEAHADGTPVNVGVDRTEFGQVLTGIVAMETAP
ncbi:MAG: hypothetical protein AMXMBFR23_03570 [Chloroflexota bacterium]